MKKIIIFILICVYFLPYTIRAENYAIIVLGNEPTTYMDTVYILDEYPPYEIVDMEIKKIFVDESKFWNDLFLMYEYLVLSAGYSPENVITFYGMGEDWSSTYTLPRYKKDIHQEWNEDPNFKISDFSNSWTSIVNEMNYLSSSSFTNKDNILIIWIEHGHGGDPDYYYTELRSWKDIDGDGTGDSEGHNYGENIPEDSLLNVFKFKDSNGNNLYNKRKIIFYTCHSGCLIKGSNTFFRFTINNQEYIDEEKTVVITSADYNESSHGKIIGDHQWSSQYPVWCALNGKNPLDSVWTYSDSTFLDDSVLSLKELYLEFYYFGQNDGGGSGSFSPQLGDTCNRADYIYITEDLILKEAILSLRTGEDFRGYWVDKITAKDGLVIPSGSKVLFAVDKKFHLKPGFKSENGAYFHAYFGEIDCKLSE